MSLMRLKRLQRLEATPPQAHVDLRRSARRRVGGVSNGSRSTSRQSPAARRAKSHGTIRQSSQRPLWPKRYDTLTGLR